MEEVSRMMLSSIMRSLLARSTGDTTVPLTEAETAALPRREVTAENAPTAACSICMEPCAVGQSVVDLECSHTYHEQCIVPWFNRHNTCPMCRRVYGAAAANEAFQATESAENASSALSNGNFQVSLLPMDVDIKFVYNTESITTRWNTQTTTVADLFNFLKRIVAFADVPDILIVNMRNVRQSFRTSQSYQQLQYTLYEAGIIRATVLHVFAT